MDNYETNEIVISDDRSTGSIMEWNSEYIAMFAEKADETVRGLKKIMNAALAITTEQDWVLIGGKPYLQESGASKVRALFGISSKFIGNNPIVEVDDKGYKTFTYRMEFSFKNNVLECEGSRSMKEDFFAGKAEKRKSIDEIDERDVRMAAFTNCVNNGIKRLVPGLRNIGLDELKEAGLDVEKIQGYTFKTGSKGGKDTTKASESGLVCECCGSAVTQAVASFSQGAYGKILCMKCQKKAKTPSIEEQMPLEGE